MGFIERIFSSDGFMPHGMCYEWNPSVIWLHVLSDGVITLAYYSIPITLLYFVRKKPDFAFDWIFVCFATFIIACGTTHLMEIINIWHPVYWLSGIIKVITALTSIATAFLLIRLIPQALALPSHEQLRASNNALAKEIEERVRTSEKMEALNQDLLLQKGRLESSNKELETFSASVAHDFRAPLRVIIGYADMELSDNREKLLSSTVHVLQKVIVAAERLNTMMSDLLAYHRANKEDLPLEEIDLNLFVTELIKEPQFEQGIFEIQRGLPTVRCNPVALNIALRNLIGNSLKFVAEGAKPRVQIYSREDAGQPTLFIQDNGLGIDEADQRNLFRLFYRGKHAKAFTGTGLGLGTAARAASRVGASLRLVSSSDEGTCFCISFPARNSLISA